MINNTNLDLSQKILLPIKPAVNTTNKVLHSVAESIDAVGLQDGMTISFHHSLRNGDLVMQLVFKEIQRKGIKGITLSASSLSLVQDALLPYFEDGTIVAIDTSGARGKIGKWIQSGKLSKPVFFRTHGGRARAIATGDLRIDVAFIGAPTCDKTGNINGIEGLSACGSMGYAMVDAAYAKQRIAVTDNLLENALDYISIPGEQIDFIVKVDSIGDPAGIATGSIRPSKNPLEKLIANYAANLIKLSPYFKDGLSFQFGSGGIAISTAQQIEKELLKNSLTASSAVGGMTGVLIHMLKEGLIKDVYDPQTFDTEIIRDIKNLQGYHEVSASKYANPFEASPCVNFLDVAVLSATEMDVNFNVNVLTNSYGELIGAPGGHPDAAAGANMTIITMPLFRGRLPMLLEQVNTIVTPGNTVDALVTEYGIALNPQRQDLIDHYKNIRLPIIDIYELKEKAFAMAGRPQNTEFGDLVCGYVEYRDGKIIDTIHNLL